MRGGAGVGDGNCTLRYDCFAGQDETQTLCTYTDYFYHKSLLANFLGLSNTGVKRRLMALKTIVNTLFCRT